MKNTKRLLALAVSAAIAAPMAAHATNGMNLESYGPIAGGMGGASMAYDNGTAAMMNNPATLGLMDEGNRIDAAVGNLRPDVDTRVSGTDYHWNSSAESFLMPAAGWVQKSGKMSYGVGVFAQGGMGTEYKDRSSPGGWFSAGWMTMQSPTFNAADPTTYSPCDTVTGGNCAPGTTATDTALANSGLAADAQAARALDERSEVSVGRLIAPFTYDINEKVVVGGSIDYVWAGMDLQMAMNGMMMGDMMMNSNSSFGSITGGLPMAFGQMLASSGGDLYGLNYGYFNFTDGSAYKGEAKGTGFAGKIGATFKVNDKLTIGATYHSETSMSDLETDNAKVSMSVLYDVDPTAGVNLQAVPVNMLGTIKVKDFQWPATMALGMSYQATDKWFIAADFKRINWSDVMSDFTMEFQADSIFFGPNDMTGQLPNDMTAVMFQNWDDQNVIQLGASYKVTNATTLRAGYNYASNPIPDETMNYLFPAVTETHYTFGVGHAFTEAQSVDFAVSHVPEVTGGGVNRFETSMAQTNWQLMYSYKF